VVSPAALSYTRLDAKSFKKAQELTKGSIIRYGRFRCRTWPILRTLQQAQLRQQLEE
jgi:hypothetical protein